MHPPGRSVSQKLVTGALLGGILFVLAGHAEELRMSKEDCQKITADRARWVNERHDKAMNKYRIIDDTIMFLQEQDRSLRELKRSGETQQTVNRVAGAIQIADDVAKTGLALVGFLSAIGAVEDVSIGIVAQSAESKIKEKVEGSVLSRLDDLQVELDKAGQNTDWEIARKVAKHVPLLNAALQTSDHVKHMLKSENTFNEALYELSDQLAKMTRALNSMRADRDRTLQRATALAALEDKIDRACPGYTSASRNQSPAPGAPVSRPKQILIQIPTTRQCSDLTPELMDQDTYAYDELSRRCEAARKR
jgi:hypothetical protein